MILYFSSVEYQETACFRDVILISESLPRRPFLFFFFPGLMLHVDNILHNPLGDFSTTHRVGRLTAGFSFKGTHSLPFAVNEMYEINYLSENSQNK